MRSGALSRRTVDLEALELGSYAPRRAGNRLTDPILINRWGSEGWLPQTWQNRPLTSKGFFQAFPNLIGIRMGPGALAVAAARAAFW